MHNSTLHKKKQHNKKGFLSILINQLFNEAPKNKEELLELIRDSEKNSLINQTTYEMLKGVIKITKQRIKKIMIPRSQMIIIKINDSFSKCLDIIIKSAHSRFPVMSQNNNYVEGFLLAKDLLPFINQKNKTFSIKKILRPPIIVPESKYVDNMLKEFRINRYHMAIVIDEFGTISGLVTIEDILEIIVGEIFDEFDHTKNMNIKKINHNTFSVNALTQIKQFNKIFHTKLLDTEVDTIGGLVMQHFKYLPKIGEKIYIQKFKFQVSISNSIRIIQLEITVPNDTIVSKI
ncbi:Magnesium and cobalt efflux protein CorC [Buchnera aphidicola (Pterocallis alni)]|uniref:CNNM family magnesium/cobalt transport protein CorC n=1 Tax=Buchnera aphidicola TaxID=9 RepID=UPI0034639230